MTRIAVIGAGRIGGTIGAAWRRAGHQVTVGVRDPDGQREGGPFATPDAAVRDADVVLFAVPGAVMDETVAGLGARAGNGAVHRSRRQHREGRRAG